MQLFLGHSDRSTMHKMQRLGFVTRNYNVRPTLKEHSKLYNDLIQAQIPLRNRL